MIIEWEPEPTLDKGTRHDCRSGYYCMGRYQEKHGIGNCEAINWIQCPMCMDYQDGVYAPRYPVPMLPVGVIIDNDCVMIWNRDMGRGPGKPRVIRFR